MMKMLNKLIRRNKKKSLVRRPDPRQRPEVRLSFLALFFQAATYYWSDFVPSKAR
jgi:hypothetical protein